VEEIPLYEPEGEGQHLYVRLTKTELTTKEVQIQLERLFGLRRGSVGFAGMKDKHAQTTQTFSLDVGHRDASFAQEAAQQIRHHIPVEVEWARFHKNKLRLGHLLGNRFIITITELDCPVFEATARATAVTDSLKQTGMPNYYGPQRFGPGGANVRQGLDILLKRQKKKGRWLQQLLLSSVQSYLCNRYLARRVAIGAFGHLLHGDVAKKYATGGLFDVEDPEVEQPRYLSHEISFTAPIYGPKMREAAAEARDLEDGVLADAPISLDDLAHARVQGTRRLGRLLIPDVKIAPCEKAIVIEFSLPKGAYATTVLREIMKDDQVSAHGTEES
jgi:tRNA pseudouridine13 synthase